MPELYTGSQEGHVQCIKVLVPVVPKGILPERVEKGANGLTSHPGLPLE